MDFSDDDLDAANLIVPHLMTALEIRGQLAAADLRAQTALDVFARLNVGVILFDAALCPVFVNPYAEALAARSDGLLLNQRTVAAARNSDTQDLHRAMAAAVIWQDISRDGSEAAMRRVAPARCYLHRESPHLPLVVSVMPLGLSGATSERNLARGILFVMEPDRPLSPDLGILVATFHLTRREAALASLLVRGADLADAASQLGLSIGTARSYLKQVMAKTDTHRQAELVSLLLRSGMQIVS